MVRGRLAAGGTVLGAVALLGVPLGVLWWWLAPRPEVTVGLDGQPLPYPVSETAFAVQGHYALIAAGAGMATGYGAFLVQYRMARRRAGQGRPPLDVRMVCLLGLVVGAALGAVLMWRTGVLLEGDAFARALAAAEPRDVITDRLRLDATAALVIWPFVAVLQYGLFDAVSTWRGDVPVESAAAERSGEADAAPAADPEETEKASQ
ncbi:hypothetical protein [Nocardiopsis suaedae]|uniref:DUF2567 domain-containing protein n=1 Tax=Nocardiopsis suaedae TaxID=3018444 RepID=A0ABT4TRA3_9ACTN|nr:hypothetical protein [Nocardiopsis suaedae]MDA2807212.1 hypothetical protein [Nocardiopsis suaedae]